MRSDSSWIIYLHDMIDSGEQLCVDTEAAVQRVTRLRIQALSKLPLEHKHGAPEKWPGEKGFDFKSISQLGRLAICTRCTGSLRDQCNAH
jgi:hypothetical protein